MRTKVIPLPLTAERLSILRDEKNITQDRVAEELNISSETVKKIEQGKTNLTPERIRQFSKYYNVDSDYILGLSDLKSKATTSAAKTTGLSEESISFISGLSPNNKTVLERLLSQKEDFAAILDNLVPLLYTFENIESYRDTLSRMKNGSAVKHDLIEAKLRVEENKAITAPFYASQNFTELIKKIF